MQEFQTLLNLLLILWFTILSVAVIMLFIELKAMKNSTHKIEYINPVNGADFQPLTEELKKAFKLEE